MAVGGVWGELVSAAESLIGRENTGKFREFGLSGRAGSLLGRDSETLGSVFPRFSNREIWSDEQGFRRPKSISQPG